MRISLLIVSVFLIFPSWFFSGYAQDIELYEQFNGRYDYIAIGNTLNEEENGVGVPCDILTSSSATLNLSPTQNVHAAYLYWSGSGSGEFEVALNGSSIVAERTFYYQLDAVREFFAAFADVTQQVQTTGNGNYTLSGLDLTNVIPAYCNSSTNYGGWAIIIIYEDSNLPLNQINLYDGFVGVSINNTTINILIENLNVIDNQGAKIGFLAWEGDSTLANNETLRINNNILSNPPLNPTHNAFNSTNSFTNNDEQWNMDIDYFDIENYIQIGDTDAFITLTSGDGINDSDFILVNKIITVLNSQLPDATVEIDDIIAGEDCGDRDVFLEYTVYNFNSTDILPANTPIAFYANNILLGTVATQNAIPIGGYESQTITLTVPLSIAPEFELRIVVDDTGNGTGIVTEIDETNNETSVDVILRLFPEIPGLTDQEKCDVVGEESFDLTLSTQQIDPSNTITFHLTEEDAENNQNAISTPEDYFNISNLQTIYVRVDNGDCFLVDSFTIEIVVCPLPDATIEITNNLNACRQRNLLIEFNVANTDGTAPLPSQTPIAFYIDNILIATDATPVQILVGGQISMSKEIEITDNIADVFELTLVVDDVGDGSGVVEELDETNNVYISTVTIFSIPEIGNLDDLEVCNEGFGYAIFDLTEQNENISTAPGDEITFYISYDDALSLNNPISFPDVYKSVANPQIIYVRLENETCFRIASFYISTKDCPPNIPEGFSPNNDNLNDYFEIEGLLDIFPDHEILIYTRNGNLIFRGNIETGFWDGNANTGLLYDGPVPAGVYYYVLNLNHPDYELFIGWLYLNK